MITPGSEQTSLFEQVWRRVVVPASIYCGDCGEPLKDGLCERCVCFICKLAKDEYDHEHNEDWQRILRRDCSRWPCRDCQRRQAEMDPRDEPQRARTW